MDSGNFSSKSKIFIRYPPGGSGHFIALLVYSLIKDGIILKNSYQAHTDEQDTYGNYHNWNTQWVDPVFNQFVKSAPENLKEAKKWIQTTYQFYETPDLAYVAHTHAIYPDAIMLAYDNTKLINITTSDNDRDQLAYNWISKSYFLHYQWALLNQRLEYIKTEYNRLLDVPSRSMNNQTDIKLLTYIQKYSIENYFQRYQNYQQVVEYPKFEINFIDIASKKIINLLDKLIEFLGIDVTESRRTNAIRLVNRYANAQISVPWQLSINEYN